MFFNELKRETFVNNDRGFEKFCDMSIKLLNKHAPKKERNSKKTIKYPLLQKIFLKQL